MKKLPWFRMYCEARLDRKLASLPDSQFRVWFNLLCYAADQDVRGVIHDEDREYLAVECASADTGLLNATIDRLVKLRVLDIDEGYIVFRSFAERQYDHPSDTPEQRRARASKSRPNSDLSPT